jgi:uncharacterized spore protein YtfJ
MNPTELIEKAQNSMHVTTVFGQPYEKDGVTVIPAASVKGGGGGGGDGENNGGGGFGLSAKPAGVYVIRDGNVEWQPALDLNQVIWGGQVLGLVALLTLRGILKRRAKRRTR